MKFKSGPDPVKAHYKLPQLLYDTALSILQTADSSNTDKLHAAEFLYKILQERVK